MSAHTPGPWEVVQVHSSAHYIPVIAADGTVTELRARAANAAANACLIGAAPDLLAAAHDAIAQLTGGYPGDPRECDWFPANGTVRALADAIAKAEGR